jgi:hypothetical protein
MRDEITPIWAVVSVHWGCFVPESQKVRVPFVPRRLTETGQKPGQTETGTDGVTPVANVRGYSVCPFNACPFNACPFNALVPLSPQ